MSVSRRQVSAPLLLVLVLLVPLLMGDMCGSSMTTVIVSYKVSVTVSGLDTQTIGSYAESLIVRQRFFGTVSGGPAISTKDFSIRENGKTELENALEGRQVELTISQQPAGQTCEFVAATWVKTPELAVIEAEDVRVSGPKPQIKCGPKAYQVGGVVKGLSGTLGLRLRAWTPKKTYDVRVDETHDVTTDGTYAFIKRVPLGLEFEVTIESLPAGQDCSVKQGIDPIVNGTVTDADVTCWDKMPEIVVTGSDCNTGVPSRSGTSKIYTCYWNISYKDNSAISCGTLKTPFTKMTATDGTTKVALFELVVNKAGTKTYHLFGVKSYCPDGNQFCGCVPGDKLQLTARLFSGETAKLGIVAVNKDYFTYQGTGDWINVSYAP